MSKYLKGEKLNFLKSHNRGDSYIFINFCLTSQYWNSTLAFSSFWFRSVFWITFWGTWGRRTPYVAVNPVFMMIHCFHFYIRLTILIVTDFAEDSVPVIEAAEHHNSDVAPEDTEEGNREGEILRTSKLIGWEDYSGEIQFHLICFCFLW